MKKMILLVSFITSQLSSADVCIVKLAPGIDDTLVEGITEIISDAHCSVDNLNYTYLLEVYDACFLNEPNTKLQIWVDKTFTQIERTVYLTNIKTGEKYSASASASGLIGPSSRRADRKTINAVHKAFLSAGLEEKQEHASHWKYNSDGRDIDHGETVTVNNPTITGAGSNHGVCGGAGTFLLKPMQSARKICRGLGYRDAVPQSKKIGIGFVSTYNFVEMNILDPSYCNQLAGGFANQRFIQSIECVKP